MNQSSTIEIRLPHGRNFNDDDLKLLRGACEALAGQYHRCESEIVGQLRALREQGWQVDSGLTWVAHAERNRKYERAIGDTPGEALCKLCQMVGLHSVEGCP